MLQTVLRIPHELAGVPIFGWGWALIVWALAATALIGISAARPNVRRNVVTLIPTMLVLALVAIWVMPFLEDRGPAPDRLPLGIAIRGYGVMLLLGVVCGVGLTMYRARRLGRDPERALAMCVWMLLLGILGARVFHVVQYWHVLRDPDSLLISLANALRFNEGGLVVYGSLIGGMTAVVIFCRRERWPLLQAGDMVAPGMMLGLALGRIGCLLNGCCHGGVCPEESLALRFPPGTHPYMKQLESGELLGMSLKSNAQDGTHVATITDGPAKQRGVHAGDEIVFMASEKDLSYSRWKQDGRAMLGIQRKESGVPVWKATWTAKQLPAESLPTRPVQIYSAINAAVLCLLLIAWHPYRRRDGELILVLLTLYPITRFLLELIRTDEPGRFGTALTISQWVSLGIVSIAVVLWVTLWRRPLNPHPSAS